MSVDAKASMVTATEKKRKVKPRMSFRGRECRKSWSSNGDVRIERNMTSDVSELARDRASVMMKTKKKPLWISRGCPFLSSLPPGTVKAAAKATVAISPATVEHDSEVRFSQSCASLRSSPCVRRKYSLGVSFLVSSRPRWDGIILSTFCKLSTNELISVEIKGGTRAWSLINQSLSTTSDNLSRISTYFR